MLFAPVGSKVVRMWASGNVTMRFLVENYPYEVILPTFPEVSDCFEFLDFVTAITYVTDVTAKHGRPLRKSRNHFIGVGIS